MSKCEIAIDYYRPDREFRTGETVQGWVRLRALQNLKCRSMHLNVFWKTHGRGNTTRQNYFQQTLFQGEWQEGKTYEYPFEFTPPLSPLTYHGQYLNIDHYVSVRADIPWSMDPRQEEEFFWRVGAAAPDAWQEQPVLEGDGGCGRTVGLTIAAILAVVAISLSFFGPQSPFMLMLLMPAATIAFFSLRSTLAERILGEVKWGTLPNCYAGEEMPSLLQIGPVGNVRIKQVTASIVGTESVVSGSGTDTTTYTHTLHKEHQVVAETPAARRGEVIELQPAIAFPQTQAWTVDLPDNRIQWLVTIAIRLAIWPDWVQTREIVLTGRPLQTSEDNSNPAFVTHSLHELIDLVRELRNIGDDPAHFESTVISHADKLFTVSLDLHQVLPAQSGLDDAEYCKGRTLAGTLSGTSHLINLQLPSRYNHEVDQLDHGQTWTGKGAVIRWDPRRETLTMMGI